MDKLLAQYLDKMLEFEEQGHIGEALALSGKLLETFPENETELLLEKAKLEFRNRMDKEALLDFITVHEKTKDEALYELILEAYYMPNKSALEENYQINLKRLKEYPHYREAEREEIVSLPIWKDDELIVYADSMNKCFTVNVRYVKEIAEEEDKAVMTVNEMWIEDIWRIEGSFCLSEPFLDMELPVYVVFDEKNWQLFLYLYDLKDLLKKNRIVFLVGKQGVYEYFREDMVIFPSIAYYNCFHDVYHPILEQAIEIRQREDLEGSRDIKRYYKENQDNIIVRIKSGKPRILFYTSCFTTALKYHTRDCMQAASRLGCEVQLLMEPDGIHRVYERDIIQYIKRFKPDIIFNIDHFRFEYSVIPKEIIWITWVQDPLPEIMDKETPLKLIDRDFVMNHFITWKKFKEVGYQVKCFMDAAIPADSHMYRPLCLNEEYEKYACDICFVCHASNVDAHIVGVLEKVPEKLKEDVCVIYKGYQDYAYETGNIFYSEKEFKEYIEGILSFRYNIALIQEIINYLAEDMYSNFNQRVYRQVLVDWILDAGFTNVKLWGSGWREEERYEKYAMGIAENGEKLSKIYQASKIVVGNNVLTTSAARAWETMLSGGFYISNYIPEEEDAVDIRKIIEVGKEVVMFYNRDDLMEKLHYYLEHEEERKAMIERGRKAALNTMTYDILMKRVLDEITKCLEKDEDEK